MDFAAATPADRPLRGLAAAESLPAGSLVLSLPQDMLISYASAAASDFGTALMALPMLAHDLEALALVWSMVERHDPASTTAPFWRALPDKFHTGERCRPHTPTHPDARGVGRWVEAGLGAAAPSRCRAHASTAVPAADVIPSPVAAAAVPGLSWRTGWRGDAAARNAAAAVPRPRRPHRPPERAGPDEGHALSFQVRAGRMRARSPKPSPAVSRSLASPAAATLLHPVLPLLPCRAMRSRKHVEDYWERLQPVFYVLPQAYPELLNPEWFNRDSFMWALELWYAYSIQVSRSGNSSKTDTCLVPVASLANHSAWPHVVRYSKVGA